MYRVSSLLALLAIIGTAGCFHWKKSSEPKENPRVATQMEIEFMQRFVDKRSGELVAQGRTPAEAHDLAVAEFRKRYAYTIPARN